MSCAHRVSLLGALLLSLGASACAHGPNYFQPSEHRGGRNEAGYRVALYTVRGPSGVVGEAKLWSRGATVAERDEVERTYVHAGVQLHNTSARKLAVRSDEVRLVGVSMDDQPLPAVAPVGEEELVVASQAVGQHDFFFELPGEVAPSDIESFVLRWKVQWQVDGQLEHYTQRTPFVELRRTRYYSPYGYGAYGIYRPYYWPYGRLGSYCADPFCNTVIVAPPSPPPRRGGRRTRSHPD